MSISVAIVGAGPAGFYTAEALLKSGKVVEIDLIERLPTPYGLIRAGVAPDHQTTKKVTRKFEETATHAAVRYFGNVEVGSDVSLDELRAIYDAVVLAVGAPADRPLGVPGEDKRGVYGSAEFVGWYNGHPDFRDLDPELGTDTAVVIGNGNVAIDVARVLVKTSDEMADSDIADYAAEAIRASPITDVYLVGRRGPLEAKFTNVELREMGRLAVCTPVVDPSHLPDGEIDTLDRDGRLKEKNLATLRDFAARRGDRLPKRVHFEFFAKPVEIVGDERVTGLRFERTRVVDGQAVGTGEFRTVPCGLVIAAIGYRTVPLDGVPFDERQGIASNTDGRVADGLYVVGWIKRGPLGVIASNRPDGVTCAEQICGDIASGAKPGRPALAALLAARGVRVVDFSAWKRIEAAETAAAAGRRPRRKFTSIAEMLRVLDGP